MRKTRLEGVDRADHIETLTRAGRAGDDVHAPMSQTQGLQDIETNLDLLHRIGGEADPDGIADPGPEQRTDADGRLDRAGAQGPGLGDAEMQRAVDGVGQLLIGGHGQKGVGGLHADLEFVEVEILQDTGVVQRALDHRLGAGLPVPLKQVPLQRAGVDADADGAAVIPRRLHNVAHSIMRADIAGIDPQACGPRLRRLDGASVVEMDVGDEGRLGRLGDLRKRRSRGLVRAGDADDVGARLLQRPHLGDGRVCVRRQGVGHRLDGDRRIAAHLYGPDADLAAGPAVDAAPGADMVQGRVRAHVHNLGANATTHQSNRAFKVRRDRVRRGAASRPDWPRRGRRPWRPRRRPASRWRSAACSVR